MSLLNFNLINFPRGYQPFIFGQRPMTGQYHQLNFKNTYQLNVQQSNCDLANKPNLRCIEGKPEIYSEADLSEEDLDRLSHSAARQDLSIILRSCYDDSFSVTEKDGQMMTIIHNSMIPGWDEMAENKFGKILQQMTKDNVEIIQEITNLETGKMSEAEMQSKANELKNKLENAKNAMQEFRQLLQEGAEIAKEYQKDKNNPELNEKIKKFENKVDSLASEGTEKEVEKDDKKSK